MNFIDARNITAFKDIGDGRVRKITYSGKEYYAKGRECPKRPDEKNETWLVNEIVYAHFAERVRLNMPKISLLRRSCDVLAVCSEYEEGRKNLSPGEQLKNLCSAEANAEVNRKQLIRALLLDLALLNSDRTIKNILADSEKRVFFIDHDKSLWGDGREKSNDGDLDRCNTGILKSKFRDYLGDYLQCKEANGLVWQESMRDCIQTEFESFPLAIETLRESLASIPGGWIEWSKWVRMESFLEKWWGKLGDFFGEPQCIRNVIKILTLRGRI